MLGQLGASSTVMSALICIGKRHTKVIPKNEYAIFGRVQGQGGICYNRSPRLDVFGKPASWRGKVFAFYFVVVWLVDAVCSV